MKTARSFNFICSHFEHAAAHYDHAAAMQAHVAACLVEMAAGDVRHLPRAILDIGCGTGLVAQAARSHWPEAGIFGIDGAPSMLAEARRKLPGLKTQQADIAHIELRPEFDLVLSSMALHWMPNPFRTLRGWQKGLKSNGRLFAALLVDGSFAEWRALCASEGTRDGLWPLPRPDFADGLAVTCKDQKLVLDDSSVRAFLQRLKKTGAAAARPGHRPFETGRMRRLLAAAPTPFSVTYRILYVRLSAPSS
ncbi:MAG: trans-aconitate 2-methyltransferase [Bdellovibrionales bacterium]